jgi:hypothetical protein
MEPAGPARVECRPAAIVAADVAGYSAPHRRRRGEDARPVQGVPRRGDRAGAAHCGRIVKTTDHGLLSSSPASSMLSDTFR